MVTRLFLVVCLLGAGASAALLAPAPKADAVRGPFLATAVGARWTYRVRVAEVDVKVVFTAYKVEADKDGVTTTVSLDCVEGPNGYKSGKFVVTKDGLDEVVNFPSGAIWQPPIRVLRLPFRDGDKWEATTTFWGWKRVKSFDTHGPERVTVPAGKYVAVRVESATVSEDDQGRPPWKETRWYAENVGIVKMTNPRETWELTAFAPGRP